MKCSPTGRQPLECRHNTELPQRRTRSTLTNATNPESAHRAAKYVASKPTLSSAVAISNCRLNARSTIADTIQKGRPHSRASKAFIRCRPLDSRLNARSPAEVTGTLNRVKPPIFRGSTTKWATLSSHIKVPDRSSKPAQISSIDPRKPTIARRPRQQGINSLAVGVSEGDRSDYAAQVGFQTQD